MNGSVITLTYRFQVVDEAQLRDVYARYVAHDGQHRRNWADRDQTTPAGIAEELLTSLDVVSEMRGELTSWDDLGLERVS